MFTQPFVQEYIRENIKLRDTGFCEGNSRVTDEIFTQKASNPRFFPIWWHHNGIIIANTVDNLWYTWYNVGAIVKIFSIT